MTLKVIRPLELVRAGKHNEPVYLKSEADKVIAGFQSELETKELEFANLKEDALNTDKAREKCLQLAKKQAMELRHQKYKRCLDKVKWCEDRGERELERLYPTKVIFYENWKQRWLELAEKYKLNNSTAP